MLENNYSFRVRTYIGNIILLVVPVFICEFIYYAEWWIPWFPMKFLWVLTPVRYDPITMYLSNFVHLTPEHLENNLSLYVLFGILSIVIYELKGLGKFFRRSLLLILAVVPFASSVYTLFYYKFFEQRTMFFSYGFSAVSSAVLGLFFFGIALGWMTRGKKDTFPTFLLLMFLTMYYFVTIYKFFIIGIMFLVLFLVVFVALIKSRENYEDKKQVAYAGLVITVLIIFLSLIFPENIITGVGTINVLGHLVGFALGIYIPLLVYQTN